jgi:eukaryotic-like serine/threonine-protein kinase
VLHQIGIGTLGPVFRTYEPTRDRLVAVKVFRLDIIPEQAQVLADALSRATQSSLFHPSIVEPIASGVEGTVAYRAEEYVAAESLDVAMRHYAPAPIDKALPFITQLAGAIDFARAAGVGHGGLHPRDIFVTPDEARATGFGVVEALEEVGIRAPIRRPYTAPERIEGAAWGTPADVFSLAAITFELLTARRPAGTGAQAGALPEGKHSAALHAVLARALDDNPARRYASALAFAGALESAARGEAEESAVAAVAAIASVPVSAIAVPEPVVPAPVVPPPIVPAPVVAPPVVAASRVPPVHEDLRTDGSAAEAAADQVTPGEFEIEAALDPIHEALADVAVTGDVTEPTLFDDDEDIDADVAPVVETHRFAEDFVEEGAAVAAPDDDLVLEQSVFAAEEPMFTAADREPDPPDLQEATDRSGSVVLPYAVLAILCLLAGFAAGYFVGSRPRQTPAPVGGLAEGRGGSAPAAAAQPAPSATGPATPEKPGQSPAGPATPDRPGQYSEQKVTAPPPAANPAAAAPPIAEPAAAAPPPARIAGHLVVRSSPSRAMVTINGEWRGRTPLTLEAVPFGKHVVRVVLEGYNVAREEVTLTAQDASRTIDARLEAKASGKASLRPNAPEPATPPRPAPPPRAGSGQAPAPDPAQPTAYTGSLYVDSRPRGATVIVDGKTMGETPLTLPEVAIGAHVVRIEMAGKKSWTSLARVTAGKLERVTGSLEDQR